MLRGRDGVQSFATAQRRLVVMKYDVTQFKSLEIALKELERFVRDGDHLRSGRRFKSFNYALSRELLANWLICAVANFGEPDRITFVTDPSGGGDGVIWDRETTIGWPTEHVFAHAGAPDATTSAEALILKRIKAKQARGKAYAAGKVLVVFVEGLGLWHPNKVGRSLPDPLDFGAVIVVGLQGVVEGEYVYQVTRVDLRDRLPPSWEVFIAKGFDSWEVRRVM